MKKLSILVDARSSTQTIIPDPGRYGMGSSINRSKVSKSHMLFGRYVHRDNDGDIVYCDETKFVIKSERFPLVLEATKKWHNKIRSVTKLPSHMVVSLFNRAMGFGTVKDNVTEDLVDIWHKGEWEHFVRQDHYDFFQSIAKYVEPGSYLNFQIKQSFQFYQWYFNGDCMVEKAGRVVFE